MNKQEIIKQYPKEEDKLLVAKILDKIQFANQKNQIQITDFLDGYEQKVAQKVLKQVAYKTAILYGGYEEAERKMLLFFPEKLYSLLKEPMNENRMIQDKMEIISIIIPNDLKGQYHHRDYLSAIIKLGMKREKVGDILVREDGADMIVQSEVTSYLLLNLPELTRFQKANIAQKAISELAFVPIQKEAITILVPQLRLDAVISEILHLSRTKANELLLKERVFVNYETKIKSSTMLAQGDLLTIRGKGKFQIGEIVNQTAKGKLRVVVEKFV